MLENNSSLAFFKPLKQGIIPVIEDLKQTEKLCISIGF